MADAVTMCDAPLVLERQVTVAEDPTATISSLSASLAAAQISISVLATQVQQVQLASVRAVASAQSLAAASAASVVASVSSSAAGALASASSLVANANARAMAAVANASSIAAQADLAQRLDDTRFTEPQLTIAVIVSIIGTVVLALIGFLIFGYFREQRQRRSQREKDRIKEMILRPNTGNSDGSAGSGDIMWDEVYSTRPPRRPPKNPLRGSSLTVRGPFRTAFPRPPVTIAEEREPPEHEPTEWPVRTTSASPGPTFSLFPMPTETDMGLRSPRQTVRRPRTASREALRFDDRGF